jgi:predicted negative regulator of RcsB-dependent stress response
VDDLQSEKEQIEEMRAWWSEYGKYVIAGVVIAVGLLFGYNQHQSNKLTAEMEASVLYETLAGHVGDGNLDNAETVADELASNYANTAYAAQSKLAMARLYMDKNRDQDAADVLSELIEMRGNKALRYVGRLRLARVLLYQDKAQEVIDLLADQDDNPAFAGLYAEIRGDAYAALGQIAEAGDAYRVALADTSQTVSRGLVQMKLMDLPEVTGNETVTTLPDIEPLAEPVQDEIADDAEAENEAGDSE